MAQAVSLFQAGALLSTATETILNTTTIDAETTAGNNTLPDIEYRNNTLIDRRPGSLNFYIFVVTVCVTGCVCLIGLCGNILAFLAFCLEKKRMPSSIILQALAVSDGLILLNTLIEFTIPFIYTYTGYLSAFYEAHKVFAIYTYPLHYFFITSSTWLLVTLTIHRYFAVCKPLHVSKLGNTTHAKLQALGVFVGSVAFNTPKFFDVQYVGITYCWPGTDDQCYKTILTENFAVSISYRIILTTLVMYVIPITTMLVMNTKLIQALRKSSRQRAAMGKKSDHESINLILIAVVFIFLMCTTPIFLSQMIMTFGDYVSMQVKYDYLFFLPILFLLVAFNAAVNFFVYTLIGRKFRQNLRRLLCGYRCRCEEREDDERIGLGKLNNVSGDVAKTKSSVLPGPSASVDSSEAEKEPDKINNENGDSQRI